MDSQLLLEILSKMNEKIDEEKDFLTELDNEIADGDHGINMAKGFNAVESKKSQFEGQSIGNILKMVGITLVSAIGGSAGPLYGTAFMRAGMIMADKNAIDINDFICCMKAAVDGVMQRGHAVYGEKTMLDAMIPALNAMETANANGLAPKSVLKKGVEAAFNGVEYTKTIAATKGRASYIGERSIGHQDPGATSFAFLLEVVANAL